MAEPSVAAPVEASDCSGADTDRCHPYGYLTQERCSMEGGCLSTSVGNPGTSCSSSAHMSPNHVLERCIIAYAKGFVIGAGLKGGLALFSAIVKAAKRQPAKNPLPRSSEGLRSLKETLRYGLFLGSYSGCFCVVDEAIAALWGNRATARWRALVAGAAAGPTLLLTGRDTHHTSMAIYILLRATVLVARCGIKSRRFHWLFRPLTWQHGDAFLMCLSSMQILYAWIMNPGTLPPTYVAFLNKHGGKDKRVIHGIRQLAFKRPVQGLSAVEALYASKGVDVRLDPYMKIPCQMVHPHENCGSHFIKFLAQAYLRSVPVYLPVYIVPALLVHRLNILKSPLPILLKTALGLARSSLFLATFCGSCWLVTCSLHQASGTCSPTTVALGTFPAGLAVLLEKKSRRMELALYCLSRAVESFALGATGRQHESARTKGATPPPLPAALARLDVLLFSAATAIIMHCYAQERDVFRSKYLNVLDWVFGVPGFPRGYKLSSVPATPDLGSRRNSATTSRAILSRSHNPLGPPPTQGHTRRRSGDSPRKDEEDAEALPPLRRELSLQPRALEDELDAIAVAEMSPQNRSKHPVSADDALPHASTSGSFPWKPDSVELLPVPDLAVASSPPFRNEALVGSTARATGVGEERSSTDSFCFIAGNPGLEKQLREAITDQSVLVELEPSGT